jgi:hypothetical protein
MITITIPADLQATLAEAARAREMAPEKLAIECLRKALATQNSTAEAPPEGTLADFLAGFIGTVDGTAEALSEDTGVRFRSILERKYQRNEQG